MRGSLLRRLAVVGLTIGLAVGVMPAALAGSSTSYDQLQIQINRTRHKLHEARKREKRIMGELAQSDARRQSLERSLATVTDELILASRRLDALQLQADQASLDLQAKDAQLQLALANLDTFTSQMQDRAANIYMNGPDTYSAVLVNSDDFHSYVAGMAYAESVLNTDLNVVDELRGLRDDIQHQRDQMQARQVTLQKQTDAVAAQQAQLSSLRAQQANARLGVLNEIGYKQRVLARVQSERRAYGEALQSMLEQSRNIEQMLQRAQRGQHVIQGRGGYLKWPVTGRITSPYGWRIHPIYHYRSFHTGIDIAAPYGTTIKAARYGTVLYVGTRDAYGLIVIIDHGNSLATVYAHMSRAFVRAGQYVRTGGAIGAVGCSGWCTGPHVHFEVRVAGKPTNPMHWL